jgi:hypothetical protein
VVEVLDLDMETRDLAEEEAMTRAERIERLAQVF